MIRKNESNHLFKCGQLLNQFLVDEYVKMETERLLYLRNNQKKLRADTYVNLRDAIANDKNVEDIGQRVILPATYTGSPRHMYEYAQDGLTYVKNYGRPDLFLTMTMDPSCAEVKSQLFDGQAPYERHDIIARVFKQKLTKLINLITKDEIYGPVRCWMYAVEWQKRGLPHAHILIWLVKKLQPTDIDKIISAELPNPNTDPELFEIIKKNMVHGPCGVLNPNAPCMIEGKCTSRYPKSFTNNTKTGNDGYPQYKRRSVNDGGFKTKKFVRNSEMEIDNKWIVPYSPILSKIFKCHINVENCNSVKSIKYICKYIFKGNNKILAI